MTPTSQSYTAPPEPSHLPFKALLILLVLLWYVLHLSFSMTPPSPFILNLYVSPTMAYKTLLCFSWPQKLPLFWDHTVNISNLNHLLQLQIFTVIISPFWFPALSFLLTLFKIFSLVSPLKIQSSLSTTFLIIPAFFSSVKLTNNEGEQVKEKGQRGRRGGIVQ